MSSASHIEEQAAQWLALQDRDPPSADLQARVDQWLAADPRHEVAYLRLRAAWRQLDRVAALGSYANARQSFTPQQPRSRSFKVAAAMAASIAVASLLGVTWWVAHPSSATPVRYSTQVGGYQRQLLADGSTVELNTGTAIDVQFDGRVRRLHLLYGEARFHVAKDTGRPFLVEADQRQVRALATDFTVHLEPGQAEVLVAEGRVGVDPVQNGASPGSSIILSAGQLGQLRPQGVNVVDLPPTEVGARLAWDRGLLVFAKARLATVAAELNRYNTLQIRIADPTAAALEVGGTFSATNATAFIHVLEAGFPVTVTRNADGVTVASRK